MKRSSQSGTPTQVAYYLRRGVPFAALAALAGGDIMLQNLSSEVAECMRHAEECAARARHEPDPNLRRDLFDMELRWRKLARSYKLAEQLQTVTSNSKQESGELTNRLELLKRRLEAVIRRT
jgi:hypothetical protein